MRQCAGRNIEGWRGGATARDSNRRLVRTQKGALTATTCDGSSLNNGCSSPIRTVLAKQLWGHQQHVRKGARVNEDAPI